MKPGRQDLVWLRRNLMLLGAAIIGSAAILYGSGLYAEHAEKKLREASRLLNQAQQTVADLRGDQQNQASYAAEYTALATRGIFDDKQRLEWVEALEQLRQSELVSNFHYVIAPQQIRPVPAASAPGDFEIHYSAMKLQFELLHEMQLVDFFNMLHNSDKGWYQLEGCTLSRTAAIDAVAAAYLAAECSGGWITLHQRGTTP